MFSALNTKSYFILLIRIRLIEKAELLMQYLAAIKDEQGNAQIGGKTVSKKDILGLRLPRPARTGVTGGFVGGHARV